MKATYYGHSCFSVEIGGKVLLFDPFISPNEKAASIDVGSVPADFILVSHGHGDHVADVEAIAKRTGALLVSTFEVVNWFSGRGIENAHPMNHGGTRDLGCAKIKLVNAVHSSSMPDGSYGGQPVGFVVESEEGNFYYSGDTALTLDMKLIPEDTVLDWAAMCIGDNFTMGVEDALKAADFVQCRKVLGLHYDTFPPIEIDHARAKGVFADAGRELVLAEIGAAVEF